MKQKSKYRSLTFALGAALSIYLFEIIILLLWILRSGSIKVAASPWIAYAAISVACFLSANRFKISVISTILVSYLFFGITLLFLNNQVAFVAWNRSPMTFLGFLFFGPVPLTISALTGTFLGRIYTRVKKQKTAFSKS